MEIKYNTPIEVSSIEYKFLMNHFSGIIAGQEKNGKFYIKCWMTKYKDQLNETITKLRVEI